MDERGKDETSASLWCTQLTLSLFHHRIILFSAMLRGDATIREGSHDLMYLSLTYPLHLMWGGEFEVKNTGCVMREVG